MYIEFRENRLVPIIFKWLYGLMLFLIFYFSLFSKIHCSRNGAIKDLETELIDNKDQFDSIINSIVNLPSICQEFVIYYNFKTSKFSSNPCHNYPQKNWIFFSNKNVQFAQVDKGVYVSFYSMDWAFGNNTTWFLKYYFKGFNFKESVYSKYTIKYYKLKYYPKDSIPKEDNNWVYQIDNHWIIYARKERDLP